VRSRKEAAMGLFIKIGTTQELEALKAGKLVEAAGQQIAVFNVGGKYWAIEDTCPHRGGPLSEGILAEDDVICPWHGSRFNVKTGAVLTPPAQRNVKSFPVRVVGTDVEVQVE
jgi:nitrite reductase/ring-hydroxylating ferredoxin subunit